MSSKTAQNRPYRTVEALSRTYFERLHKGFAKMGRRPPTRRASVRVRKLRSPFGATSKKKSFFFKRRGAAPELKSPVLTGAASLAAAGVGAVAMYFLDPDRGHARRAGSRDHLLGIARRATRRALRSTTRRAHYSAGRLRGATHTLKSAMPNGHHGIVDDITLADKIRSEVLGREPFTCETVHVDCYHGVVHLRGEIDSAQTVDQLISRVRRVEGVTDVESFLHPPGVVAPNKASALAAEASALREGSPSDNGGFRATGT